MAAYEPELWSDFGVAVAGAAAALTGLLFVAVSINLRDILSVPQLPARAASTLGLLVTLLLVGVFLVSPGHSRSAMGAEMLALGALSSIGPIATGWHRHQGRVGVWAVAALLLQLIPALLLIVGGVSLLIGAGGGLYWVMAAVVTGFASAVANSWILMIKIPLTRKL